MEQPSEITAEVPRPWARPAVTYPVLALLSLVGGQLPSFSLQANLYVLAVGGAMLWLGLSHRLPRRPAPRRLGSGVAWWLVPVLVFAAVELINYGLGSTPEHPTLSKLTDPALDDKLVRSAAYFAWLTAFWGLVRR
jgi:hypothetical protein